MSGNDSGATPVDLAFLATQTFGIAELEAEVLRLFVEQSRSCLDRLANRPDADTAHLILGSARGIGAREVAATAAKVETALRDGKPATDDIARLGTAVEAAIAFITKRQG